MSLEPRDINGPSISLSNLSKDQEEPKPISIEERQREEFALASGEAHYLELTNPIEYKKKADEEVRLRSASAGGVTTDFYGGTFGGLYGKYNRISLGGLTNRRMAEGNEVSVGLHVPTPYPKNADEYLACIMRVYKNAMMPANTDYIRALQARGNLKELKKIFGDAQDNLEWRDAKIKELTEEAERRIQIYSIHLKKHAEGFGRAALKAGDKKVALDNLFAAGILENKEIQDRLLDIISDFFAQNKSL